MLSARDGKQTGQSPEPLIQFGWWTVIAKPLYLSLRFLNEHGVPNWGWDILIITVIFNLLMLPTRLMMMRSSLKMQRIQPKVDALEGPLFPPERERPQAGRNEYRDDGAL